MKSTINSKTQISIIVESSRLNLHNIKIWLYL